MQKEKATLTVDVRVSGNSEDDVLKVMKGIPSWIVITDMSPVSEDLAGRWSTDFKMVRRACWGNWISDARKNLQCAVRKVGTEAGLAFSVSNPHRDVVERRAAALTGDVEVCGDSGAEVLKVMTEDPCGVVATDMSPVSEAPERRWGNWMSDARKTLERAAKRVGAAASLTFSGSDPRGDVVERRAAALTGDMQVRGDSEADVLELMTTDPSGVVVTDMGPVSEAPEDQWDFGVSEDGTDLECAVETVGTDADLTSSGIDPLEDVVEQMEA